MATSDDFNRSDETPLSGGGAWVSGPGASDNVQLVGQKVRLVTNSTEGVARRATPAFSASQVSQCQVVTRTTTTEYAGPAVRINSTTDADHYLLRPGYTSTAMNIRRITDSGSLSGATLGAAFGTFSVNDTLRLEAAGKLLIAKQNGTIVATRVDGDFASGQPGVHLYSEMGVEASELDNWLGDDLAVTRLYLPSSGAAPVNFAFAAGWEKTTGADRIAAVADKSNTALTDKTCSEDVTTGTYDVLARQYCYGPLVDQTIAGTVRGVIRVQESDVGADFRAQLVIRVMAADGTTVRGTLLDFDTASLVSEFPTTAASRWFPLNWDLVTLTPVTAQAGDYVVIEVGIRAHNTEATNFTATFRFGDPTAGTDRTEDETATDDNVPWLEFTQPLVLQGGGSGGSGGPLVNAQRLVSLTGGFLTN